MEKENREDTGDNVEHLKKFQEIFDILSAFMVAFFTIPFLLSPFLILIVAGFLWNPPMFRSYNDIGWFGKDVIVISIMFILGGVICELIRWRIKQNYPHIFVKNGKTQKNK